MSNYQFNTFSTVVDEAYDELSVDGDSTPFPGLSRANMERRANRFKDRFLSKIEIKTQESSDTFVTVADTTLDDATADEGDTDITIASATGWPAAGLAVVDGYAMTFTRSGTTLTVAALPRDFDNGATVQLGYALPSTFLRPRSLYVDGKEHILRERGDSPTVLTSTYNIIDDYFVMPLATSGGQEVIIHFVEKGEADQTSTDTLQIMKMFDDYLVYELTAVGHRVMGDLELAAEYSALANEVFRDAREHFNREESPRNKMFLPRF